MQRAKKTGPELPPPPHPPRTGLNFGGDLLNPQDSTSGTRLWTTKSSVLRVSIRVMYFTPRDLLLRHPRRFRFLLVFDLTNSQDRRLVKLKVKLPLTKYFVFMSKFQGGTPIDIWRGGVRKLSSTLNLKKILHFGRSPLPRSVFVVLGWWVNRFAWINWIPRDWFLFAPRSRFTWSIKSPACSVALSARRNGEFEKIMKTRNTLIFIR